MEYKFDSFIQRPTKNLVLAFSRQTMNKLQEKILKLEMELSKVKDYPPLLINALKFGKPDDDKEIKKSVDKRSAQLAAINKSLADFIARSEQVEFQLQETQSLVEGNRRFFDSLMSEFNINTETVDYFLRGNKQEREDEDITQDSNASVGEDDQEDSTFDICTKNLNELKVFNETYKRNGKDLSLDSILRRRSTASSKGSNFTDDEDLMGDNFHNIMTFRENSTIHTPYKY